MHWLPKLLFFKWSFFLKRGNLLSCFLSWLETQVLVSIYIYIHSNSSRCPQLYLKHAKCLPMPAIKEMSTLSNLKNTSQKGVGGIIWIKNKKSQNKLSRNEKVVGGNPNATEGKWERAWRVATEW